MGDSGARSNKGYKVQTFITLLEALNERNKTEWVSFTLEPKHKEEIVDIHFVFSNYEAYYQVKSSKNKFSKTKSLSIINKLRANAKEIDNVRLVLVGEADFSHEEIIIRTGGLSQLKDELSTMLGRYIEREFIDTLTNEGLEVLSSALLTDTEILTLEERVTFDKEKFKQVILKIYNALIKNNQIELKHFSNLQQFKGWLNDLIRNYNIETNQMIYSCEQLCIIDNLDFQFKKAYDALREVAYNTILWDKFRGNYLTLNLLNQHINNLVPQVIKAIEDNNQEAIAKLDRYHLQFKESNHKNIEEAKGFQEWINVKYKY